MYKVTLLDKNGNNCGEIIARNINEANKISDSIMEDIIDLGLKSKYPNKCKIEEIMGEDYYIVNPDVMNSDAESYQDMIYRINYLKESIKCKLDNMYNVYLYDDWDRLVKEWKVKTKKEAEELKEYIENKIKDFNLKFQFSLCEIGEVEEGNKEIVDEFFEDVLKYNKEKAEERKERNMKLLLKKMKHELLLKIPNGDAIRLTMRANWDSIDITTSYDVVVKKVTDINEDDMKEIEVGREAVMLMAEESDYSITNVFVQLVGNVKKEFFIFEENKPLEMDNIDDVSVTTVCISQDGWWDINP